MVQTVEFLKYRQFYKKFEFDKVFYWFGNVIYLFIFLLYWIQFTSFLPQERSLQAWRNMSAPSQKVMLKSTTKVSLNERWGATHPDSIISRPGGKHTEISKTSRHVYYGGHWGGDIRPDMDAKLPTRCAPLTQNDSGYLSQFLNQYRSNNMPYERLLRERRTPGGERVLMVR